MRYMRRPPRPRLRLRHLLAAAAALVALLVAVAPPQDTVAATDHGAEQYLAERYLYDAVNYVRADHGLPMLTFRDEIVDVSRGHAARMANEWRLYHNPDRRAQVEARVPDWQRIGENVGWSTTAQGLHSRLMASDTHRAVILGDYTQLAIGVTYRDGRYWMTQTFIKATSR
jgi:uncharacterized protein YkwD